MDKLSVIFFPTLALKSNEKESQVAFVQDVETQTESKKSTLDDGM